MSTPEEKKGDKMRLKSEHAQRNFNLPDTECVIQDYSCAMKRTILVQGRLWITQNYCCFAASLGSSIEVISFRKVAALKKATTAFVINNAIEMDTESGRYAFGSFVHRDEVLSLLQHLWKHPPTFVLLDDLQPKAPEPEPRPQPNAFASNDAFATGAYGGHGGYGRNGGYDNAGGGGGYGANGNGMNGGSRSSRSYNDYDDTPTSSSGRSWGGGQQQQQQVAVDLEASRNALRTAQMARQIGTDTLQELEQQAEQIDRIENNVEHIHANMDRSDRLLRGIESLGGAMVNGMTVNRTTKEKTFDLRDREIAIKPKDLPVTDVEILLKHKNDMLSRAILRFTVDQFLVLDGETKKPLKKLEWPYDLVDVCVLRARPFHADIRFYNSKKNPRLRLMSSYIQTVVNELSLRTPPGKMNVVFEPGTRQFHFGSPFLSNGSSKPRGAGGGGGGGGFFRSGQLPKASNTLFKDAPVEIKQDLDEQEGHLDEISDILGDLSEIADSMGLEIDRQTEHLQHVSNRVDQANERVGKTNQRIDRML